MSNTLYQQAHQAYVDNPGNATLQGDFETILSVDNGWVLSSPDIFCLARTVFLGVKDGKPIPDKDDPSRIFGEHTIIHPMYEFQPEHINCWHIHVLAGDMEKLFTWMPFRLPYVSWEKRGQLRVHKLDDVINRIVNV